ncbi:hypothetical protein BKA67DRAFT_305822 [Truncatella angustata]|uniref:Uncharacterized protein n=1 Tax=Truncatella angustata TaxID=152316 RepID=A0A9P8ZXC9_9PEZI|nr:uncharacterized protein BKA67DRAFT_305822 [Truncatella angustata]KAH6652953.1 hypothetical protein BKA67DRAFT_305822 [Truncatella angustata]
MEHNLDVHPPGRRSRPTYPDVFPSHPTPCFLQPNPPLRISYDHEQSLLAFTNTLINSCGARASHLLLLSYIDAPLIPFIHVPRSCQRLHCNSGEAKLTGRFTGVSSGSVNPTQSEMLLSPTFVALNYWTSLPREFGFGRTHSHQAGILTDQVCYRTSGPGPVIVTVVTRHCQLRTDATMYDIKVQKYVLYTQPRQLGVSFRDDLLMSAHRLELEWC